jgi:hypothetical protein
LLIWWAYRALYIRGACQALAEAMRLDVESLRDPSIGRAPTGDTQWAAMYDLLDGDLADLSGDPKVAHIPSEVLERDQRALAVLRLVDALGPSYRAAEKAELEALLGHAVETNESGLEALDAAIRDGSLECTDADLVRFFYARADRQCTLLRPAMAAMADGHFSSIE